MPDNSLLFPVMQKAIDYARRYSVAGEQGPLLASLSSESESLSCSRDLLREAEECHWMLMQSIDQLLRVKQDMFLSRDNPLVSCGHRLARQANDLHLLREEGLIRNLHNYTILCMALDDTMQRMQDALSD